MTKKKTICVVLGACHGAGEIYRTAAKQLGTEIARRGHRLVYGGGRLGLMGVLADAVLENGGEVVGIMPKFLYESEAYPYLENMHLVETMQERKKMMADMSDGFIAMPGGLGTFEEVFEFWSASKLELHPHAIGFLNTAGFYDKLLQFIDHTIHQEFLDQRYKNSIHIDSDPSILLNKIFTNLELVTESHAKSA